MPYSQPLLWNELSYDHHFQICLTLSKLQNSIEIPTLKVVVMSLGTNVIVKPFDNHVSVYLGGIYLQHTQFKGDNILLMDYIIIINILIIIIGVVISMSNFLCFLMLMMMLYDITYIVIV